MRSNCSLPRGWAKKRFGLGARPLFKGSPAIFAPARCCDSFHPKIGSTLPIVARQMQSQKFGKKRTNISLIDVRPKVVHGIKRPKSSFNDRGSPEFATFGSPKHAHVQARAHSSVMMAALPLRDVASYGFQPFGCKPLSFWRRHDQREIHHHNQIYSRLSSLRCWPASQKHRQTVILQLFFGTHTWKCLWA